MSPLLIENYDFGRIQVDGEVYTSDIKIIGNEVKANWWRKEGHSLCLEDIPDILEYKPEILIIGNGYSGAMQIPADVCDEFKKRGIKYLIQKTTKAVDLFNEENSPRKAAAFHLTC